ncbi:MAG: c-type cytochrome [Planctomycetota bacterium]|jgi:hypothetical protein
MNGNQRLLLFAILIFGMLHYLGWSEHDQRNYEVMPDMYESVPYGSLDANPNFADGKTAQAPIEGTIARGFAPMQANGILLDVTRDWKDLDATQQAAWNGFAGPEETDPERGREVFEAICATCHGDGGGGDGPATKRGVPPPPALFAQGAMDMSDGRMYRIITAGQGNMASHATQVSRADRWRVIRFVRSLQPK